MTRSPRRTPRLVAVAATAVLLASPHAVATTAAAGATTPDAAERRYLACIDGAPRSADAQTAWVLQCREAVADDRW